MFDWLIRFFKKLLQPNTVAPQNYAGKNVGVIQFSSQLIPQLKDEHTELVQLYGSIGQQLAQQQFTAVHDSLEVLKDKFQRHIMQENVQFYCYLEKFFHEEPQRLDEIKEYRKEMNAISSAVVKFIKKWQNQPIDSMSCHEFHTEYEAVGKVLAKRIDQEENHLYTLYQNRSTD